MSVRKVVRIVKVVAVLGVALVGLGVLARALMPRFMICLPVSLRMGAQTGCWVLASKALGVLPSGQVYWRIDRFPDRLSAEAATGPNSAVVESYGTVWLFAITAEGPRPMYGEPVAMIGPLPVAPDTKYTADYMEGTFSPGMRSIALIVIPVPRRSTTSTGNSVSKRRARKP